MIPKIIHQTWRDHNLPVPNKWPDSWKQMNPGWEYRLWTDNDLAQLVTDHYPHLLDLYNDYPNPVQRADMGRYLILDHCGGIYADLDTECYSLLDAIADEDRIVISEEPYEHLHHALPLGLTSMLFNGVMASPKGHPFWQHLLNVMVRCRHAKDYVLESTGPLVLTGAYRSFDAPQTIAVHSCHLFNPLTKRGYRSGMERHGDYAHLHISNHFWGGSWFSAGSPSLIQELKRKLRKTKYKLKRGDFVSYENLKARIDVSQLHQPISPTDTNIAVLIPVRDAEPFLDRCFELLLQLDYPKDRLKLVFCEGDSIDGTSDKLNALAEQHRATFRDIIVTHFAGLKTLDRTFRWAPEIQKTRRAHLARVRNHLIDTGLTIDDHWALWIDADVCDYSPDILNRLLSEHEKVVTPDCVREWGERSYDLNAFIDDGELRNHIYYKHVHAGLFMPPKNHHPRRHLHTMRFLDRVPLTSVGGTMLLVHAPVHRAGIRFPDVPYDDLLETEAFGRACRDFGVGPIGLPNVQIKHVES